MVYFFTSRHDDNLIIHKSKTTITQVDVNLKIKASRKVGSTAPYISESGTYRDILIILSYS